jgi:hypothetical protein
LFEDDKNTNDERSRSNSRENRMSIEAMKQALEALDTCHWDYDSEEESYKTFDEDLVNDASEALRQAIEQAEQWDTSDMAHRSGGLSVEQAEKQEPVAWIQEDRIVPEIGYDCTMTREHPKELGYKPLYTAPQKYCPSENNAAYEKGFVEGMAKQMHSSVDRAVNAMTKPWVGLTDEEIDAIGYKYGAGGLELMNELTSKLKEKNT